MVNSYQWRSLRRRFCRSFRRLFTRVLPVLLTPIFIYLAIVAVGLIPVNNDFQSDPDGIEVRFTSSLLHADIVLPIANDIIDWRREFAPDLFAGDTSAAEWVVLGWGDREYFAQLPTWHNSKFLSALHALFWPSKSCMQVYFTRGVRSPQEMRSVKLTPAQYRQVVKHIQNSLRRQTDGTVQLIPGANRGKHDIFLEANGLYSALNTCNNWIGRAMQSAGIRTGWFTPLPKTVFLYLSPPSEAR
ncbi:MAG: TIGR02117 family protein [Cyanobacteria bacterium P01_C01_bin.89]